MDVCMSLHAHLGGEYPLYKNSTTGHYLPRRGKIISGIGGTPRDEAHPRP